VEDTALTPRGSRGVGEIGTVGTAAAVANAATTRRRGDRPHRHPTRGPQDVDAAIRAGLTTPGPGLIDVVTNADEVAIPPKPTLTQGWGFAIAKLSEELQSS